MRRTARFRRILTVLMELGPRGLLNLVGIYLMLLSTYLRLAAFPHALNRTWLFPPDRDPLPEPSEEQRAQISHASRLLTLCSRFAPRRGENGCLRRALTLRAWLRRRGIASRVVYGAAKGASGFTAHAWLEAGSVKVEFIETMSEFGQALSARDS